MENQHIELTLLLPEFWFYLEFKHALNYAAQVVTENLAKCFIHLSCFRFTS